MGKVDSFEELVVWKESRIFNQNLYQTTNNSLFEKDFDLKRQIRRASISVISNIAEGFERNTDKEFKQFLYYSKGSAGEVRSQLYLALDLQYLNKIEFDKLKNHITENIKNDKWIDKIFRKLK